MKIEPITYNGWTNYATWRVMLEYFDGATPYDLSAPEGEKISAQDCAEIIDDFIDYECQNSNDIVRGWARYFLSDVNWQEIADAINEGA